MAQGILSGSWSARRVISFAHLGLAFWLRQLRRLLRGRADNGGVDRFLENFAHEGLAPLDAAQEALIVELGRCVACGLCEAVCPELATVDRWPAWARALADAEHAAQDVPPGCPEGCRLCADVCPTAVPLGAIPGLIHRALGIEHRASGIRHRACASRPASDKEPSPPV